MSPVEYPTATAEPGRSVCGGNAPSGPGGTLSTGRPAFAPAAASACATGPVTPLTVNGAAIGRADASAAASAARAAAAARRAAGVRAPAGHVDWRADDRLDRRGQRDLAAVLVDRLRHRADLAAHALRVRAVDRRAREPRAEPGRVDRRPGRLEQDPPSAARRLAGGDVEHAHVERADLRALDHRVAGAAHPGLTCDSGMIGSPANAGAAGTSRAATAAASGKQAHEGRQPRAVFEPRNRPIPRNPHGPAASPSTRRVRARTPNPLAHGLSRRPEAPSRATWPATAVAAAPPPRGGARRRRGCRRATCVRCSRTKGRAAVRSCTACRSVSGAGVGTEPSLEGCRWRSADVIRRTGDRHSACAPRRFRVARRVGGACSPRQGPDAGLGARRTRTGSGRRLLGSPDSNPDLAETNTESCH